MIKIYDFLKVKNLKSKMIMQVHDELVFEVDEGFVDEANLKIMKLMSSCYSLDVPLIVDVGIGDNWDKAH